MHEGTVLRAYIHHAPWPLQNAEAEFKINAVAAADGVELPETGPALLHYAKFLEVLVWWPEKA